MIISIASGKGGTGKTTVAVNLALSIENAQLLDCDVEEPNAALFLNLNIKEKTSAYRLIPKIDKSKCNYCAVCRDVCQYNALAVIPPVSDGVNGDVIVFSNMCHSCGACSLLCPQGAISEVQKEIGIIEYGFDGPLAFAHGRLNIGEVMAPPLIKQVKKLADNDRTVIIDAPPGTSCPVMAAVKGSDYCVLVTEPTPFGLNDLSLAVDVVRKLNVPFGVVINRSDIGDNKTQEYCDKNGIKVLMKIPFNRKIAVNYSNGVPIVNTETIYKEKFVELYRLIKELV